MSGHPDVRCLIDGQGQACAPELRLELLKHIRACAECRAALTAGDPSRLFSLLALDPVPQEVLDRVSRRVRRAVDVGAEESPAWRRLALGSLAASLLLAGVLGTYLWTRPAPVATPQAGMAPIDRPRTVEEAVPAGWIEVLESPGQADVLELAVGDARLVMIFDEDLDL